MAAEKLGPLKSYVLRRAPVRLSMHGRLRDSLVEMVVEEWPVGCRPDRIEEVLKARVAVRLRERYGSVIAIFIVSALANVIVKLIIEWWFSRAENRTLMAEWIGG